MYHKALGPRELIAGAPAFLKFVVSQSIVVYLFDASASTNRLHLVAAFGTDTTIEKAESWSVRNNIAKEPCTGAIVIAVSDDEQHDEYVRQLLDATQRSLQQAAGVRVHGRLLARNVTTAGQWLNIDTGETGPTYPWTDSVVVANAVYSGTVIYPSRGDMIAAINPPAIN